MPNHAQPSPEDIFNSGVDYLNAGDLNAALQAFEQVTREQPDVPTAHWMRGVTLSAMGEHETAIAAFQAGLDLVPDEPFALYNLGMAYLHTGRWEEAMRALRLAIQLGVPNPMALLLLGFASGAHFGAVWPHGFGEWMRQQMESSQDEEELELNLEDPTTVALSAFAFAALGHAEEAETTALRLSELDARLAQRFAPALRLAVDTMEPAERSAPSDDDDGLPDISDVNLGEPLINPDDDNVDWEERNNELRNHLARFSHFGNQEIEPSPESYEELYRAFLEGYFLVPLEEEPQEVEDDGETRVSFTLRLRPHDAFDGELCAVAFTGTTEAAAFLDPDINRHRMVLPGSVLASMLADMARVLEPEEDNDEEDNDRGLGALIVNPSGPFPFVFTLRDLLMLASGGVPLHGDHTVIADGSDFSIRRYGYEELESPSRELLRILRTAISEVASELGVEEVYFFEVTIGNGQPHLGLGVAPGTEDVVTNIGNLVLPLWEENAPPHAVYDVVPLEGDLGVQIRAEGERLWPA